MLPGRARDCAEKAFVFKPVQILFLFCWEQSKWWVREGRAGESWYRLARGGTGRREISGGAGADGCARERTLGPGAP